MLSFFFQLCPHESLRGRSLACGLFLQPARKPGGDANGDGLAHADEFNEGPNRGQAGFGHGLIIALDQCGLAVWHQLPQGFGLIWDELAFWNAISRSNE